MRAAQKRAKKTVSSKPNYRAPALEKGLDILELLAEQPDGLTQGEIARTLGRSVSEIFRMLNCLVERSYVSLHQPADVYTLSLRLFEISHRHPPIRRLIGAALPLMTEVTREIDQSCHLTVANNDHILVVAQMDNPGGLGFSVRIGLQLDLLQTSSGLVMLTFQSDAERKRILHAYQQATGEKVDYDALEKRFAKIRARGYEEANSLQVSGIINVSFPVFDFSGHAFATLVVPFLRRVDQDSVKTLQATRKALQNAATKLSAAVGRVS